MKNLKRLFGKCGKRTGVTGLATTDDLQAKCNVFNHSFVSCAMNLISIYSTTGHAFKKWLPSMEHSKSFLFQHLAVLEIRTVARELKVNKATGVDGIPSRLLNYGADLLIYPLKVFFNLSVQKCKIHGKWKKAKVMPLYKNGVQTNPKNFHPISVLQVASKVHVRRIHN